VENATRYGRGFTLWFTGLSGAGKTTIAEIVERDLRWRFGRIEVLDGDIVRTNLSKEARDQVRRRIGDFIEVYVDCPVEVCAERDVKGLYKKAYAGEIKEFTGVSDPYEPPAAPELTLRTNEEEPQESARKVIERLEELGYLWPVEEFDRA
jgi:adenylylsulfate kinase